MTTCASCGKGPAPPAPDDVATAPITHCEWCGAEYPIPEAGPAEDGAEKPDSDAPAIGQALSPP